MGKSKELSKLGSANSATLQQLGDVMSLDASDRLTYGRSGSDTDLKFDIDSSVASVAEIEFLRDGVEQGSVEYVTDGTLADSYMRMKAGGYTGIKIEASGCVKMPYQPRAWIAKTNSDQSHTTGTTRKVSFDTSHTSNGMSFDNSNDRITVPVAGNYLITAQASTSLTDVYTGDGVYMHVRKNGSNIWSNYAIPLFSTGSAVGEEAAMHDSYIVPLSASDYIELWLTDINSGGNDFKISTARLTAYLVG